MLTEKDLLKKKHYSQVIKLNETRTEYRRDQCIHNLFEDQVFRTPDAVAVVFNDEELTYRTLNQSANKVAHYLRQMRMAQKCLLPSVLSPPWKWLLLCLASLKRELLTHL